MTAEIISIGTEILLGNIVNTNAQYLAKQLADYGVGLYRQTVVGDNSERLALAFADAFSRSDLVVTTGGLGPTDDDLTKETAARYFNRDMVLHKQSLDKIEAYFRKTSGCMTENNKRQAYFPDGSQILQNDNGTAPGCLLEADGKTLIMLPGPPFEMIAMFEQCVVPYLRQKQQFVLISRILRLTGIGESAAADIIDDLIKQQTNPTIATYAGANDLTVRITAKAQNDIQASEFIKPVADAIYARLGGFIYSEGEQTLEETVVNLLKQKGLMIACAESCTGGLLAARLISVPGVSEVFFEGAVTYSNASKTNRLGVSEQTLSQFGAVSSQTAVEMAAGIAKSSGSQVGISTTGIAGPSGGTDEKPVGLVYVGLYVNGETYCKQLNLSGGRGKIRNRTVNNALDFIRTTLLGFH